MILTIFANFTVEHQDTLKWKSLELRPTLAVRPRVFTAMAVGMATAESILRANFEEFNNGSDEIIGHFTYVVCGDGDFQEPVVLGAGSMAGHWGLSRLIVYYDSNNAQISGKVDRSDSTNYSQVFEVLVGMFRKLMVTIMKKLEKRLKKRRSLMNPV